MNEIAAAYSPTAAAWQSGPARIYDVLSEHLVAHAPCDLARRRVLDLGAGAGAATRALLRRGAKPIGLDAAEGMLRVEAHMRPPAVLADAMSLPLRAGAVDGVVAAYTLNHLTDPVAGLREAARVTGPGGPILAAVYARDDEHPAKRAVDQAAREAGHREAPWYERMRAQAMPLLATAQQAEAALRCAGLSGHAVRECVLFPELGPHDLVLWRLGMPNLAPFAASLDDADFEHLVHRALDLLGADPPTLERRIITVVART